VANYAPRRTSFDTGDRRWLPDHLKAETHGVTLSGSAFTAGLVKSGTVLGKITATGLLGPYSNAATDGRQTAVGHLLNDVEVAAGERHHVAVVHAGTVKESLLPTGSGLDAAAKAELTAVVYV